VCVAVVIDVLDDQFDLRPLGSLGDGDGSVVEQAVDLLTLEVVEMGGVLESDLHVRR
jgi:hypothetical protein